MKKRKKAAVVPSRETTSSQAAATTNHPKGGASSRLSRRPFAGHLMRCVALLLLVSVVYSNSFQSGWVFDNQFIIKLDPRIKQATWENFKLIWGKDYWWPRMNTGAYRPLVTTTYWLNWSVFGGGDHARETDQSAGFHAVNLAAHGITAMLAYLLVRRILRRDWAAFFAAALFAVHPIGTEAVTNVVGRADLFVTMFFFGCTLLYIRSTEATGFRRLPWLLGVMALFTAACFSKEAAPAFLAIPLLYDSIYRWTDGKLAGRRAKAIAMDWLVYAMLSLPLLGVLYIRGIVYRETVFPLWSFVDNPITKLDWSEANTLAVNINNWILAILTAFKAAALGISRLIWPAWLSSDYSYDQIRLFRWDLSVENILTVFAALLILGSVVFAAWCWRRDKAVSFFILFFWIAWGPTANFLATTGSILAERSFYLPLIAFCALLVSVVEKLSRRFGLTLEFRNNGGLWPQLAPRAVLSVIVVLFGIRAYVRNFDWRTDITLAESAVNISPRSFRSHGKLAEALYQSDPINNLDRILELSETSLRIVDPLPNGDNVSLSYLAMGLYYGLKGERMATRTAEGMLVMNDQTREWYEKSARVLERGVEIDQETNRAYHEREARRGRTDLPDLGEMELYMYLGMAYARLGMDEKAIEAFRYMRHLAPKNANAYAQIASSQIALGKFEDAAVSLIQCVVLDANRLDCWQLLADIYTEINPGPAPAIQLSGGRASLQEDNKMVQEHLGLAYAGLVRIARASKNAEMVQEARDIALTNYRVTSTLFEDAFSAPVGAPPPPAPVFHVPGTKFF